MICCSCRSVFYGSTNVFNEGGENRKWWTLTAQINFWNPAVFVFRPVFCLFCIFSIFFELPHKYHNNYLIMNRRLSMVYRFAPVQLIAVCVSQQGHGWFTESCTASSPLFDNLCFCSSAPRPLQPRWVCVTTLIVSFTTELITVCFIGSMQVSLICVCFIVIVLFWTYFISMYSVQLKHVIQFQFLVF